MKFKILILTILLSSLVIAVPNLDNHQFYGAVSWDEGVDLDFVKLLVSGEEFNASITDIKCDKVCIGKYGYENNILRVQGVNGATVEFFLGTTKVTSYPYQDDGITELNLDVSTVKLPKENCQPDWKCVEWSVCSESKQTRSCTDANECDPEFLTTTQEQNCGVDDVGACSMEWDCTEWGSCTTGVKTRLCSRSDNCGADAVSVSRPSESQSCSSTTSIVPPAGTVKTVSTDVGDLVDEEDEEGMSTTLIFGIIMILLAIGAGVYFLFFKKPDLNSEVNN